MIMVQQPVATGDFEPDEVLQGFRSAQHPLDPEAGSAPVVWLPSRS
jgi:hypothetical protein